MSRDAEIALTSADLAALVPLLDDPSLREELLRARLLSAGPVPRDLAVMNSRIAYEDLGRGERHEMTIVYPQDADDEAGRVSVLAPIGMALLGLREGQSIDWPFPNGERRRLRLLQVLAQPDDVVVHTLRSRARLPGSRR